MEALYAKLYSKYTKLKKERESQLDKLNKDQEIKFMNYVDAADEMIQHLKSENDKLHEQVEELKSELTYLRSSNDDQSINYQKLLTDEKEKNKELSEEISRLQKFERNECSRSSMHEEIGDGQDNPDGDIAAGGTPGRSATTLIKKRKFVHTTEGTTAAYLDHTADQQVYGDKGSDTLPNIQQPPCCQRKIFSSGGDGTESSSDNCVFQHLLELVFGVKVSPLTQSKEPCMLVHHKSSGYSFSLTWITNSHGKRELVYRVLSLGTIENIAPEWMKETLIFNTNMCDVFFERVSRVIRS